MKGNGQSFEIIFLSSDRDEASFNDYYKEMPWYALKFGEPEKVSDTKRTD
jgi:nucleoredoxin